LHDIVDENRRRLEPPQNDAEAAPAAEEIRKFDLAHEGLTLVPLKVYITGRGLVKVQLGLCRGVR
jgi:hypothetical protein